MGVPSIFLAITLLTSGKAEGALFTISLFLAWIGATLAIGVGSLIHGSFEYVLPTVFPVRPVRTSNAPPSGYEDTYQGFPFKRIEGGKIEILTSEGPKTYSDWDAFIKAVGQ